MRRTEARSAGIHRPAGVARSFQVRRYKVEPCKTVTACNLLAKDCDRPALTDKMEERGPQVPLVRSPLSFACRAERLAGTGTCPDGTVIRPSCATQSMGPDSDTGEKMTLPESGKVGRHDIFNTPCVNFPRRDMSGFHQLPQPCGCKRVYLVIVGAHIIPRLHHQAGAATLRRRPHAGAVSHYPLFLRFQYCRAFAMDVNILVLVQSHSGHRSPTNGPNRLT